MPLFHRCSFGVISIRNYLTIALLGMGHQLVSTVPVVASNTCAVSDTFESIQCVVGIADALGHAANVGGGQLRLIAGGIVSIA